jgi:hypothetical protein
MSRQGRGGASAGVFARSIFAVWRIPRLSAPEERLAAIIFTCLGVGTAARDGPPSFSLSKIR